MRPALLASALPVRGGLFTVLLGLLLLLRWWRRWQRWGWVPGRELPRGRPSLGLGRGRLGTGAQTAKR